MWIKVYRKLISHYMVPCLHPFTRREKFEFRWRPNWLHFKSFKNKERTDINKIICAKMKLTLATKVAGLELVSFQVIWRMLTSRVVSQLSISSLTYYYYLLWTMTAFWLKSYLVIIYCLLLWSKHWITLNYRKSAKKIKVFMV